jgi:hypothetical protein
VRITERDFFQRYERVSVSVESYSDVYVTVFRIDTDGRIRVLYPRDPSDNNFVLAGRTYRIPNPYGQRGDHAFVVDDYPGVGYVYVVASLEPFDYRPYIRNDHWEWRYVAHNGRITGDPYVAFVEVVEQILPRGGFWSFDVVPYFVERQHQYPRFLCYECHTYVPHPAWDPYASACPRFQVQVFEYVVRYPTVVYPTTRVVGPASTVRPRYVMKPRSSAEPFVSRVRRETDPRDTRTPERGVRGSDLGGVGTVPAPVRAPTRRVTNAGSDDAPERRAGGVGGLLRRLFGGGSDADDKSRREPTVQREGDEKAKQVRPKLERREPSSTANPSTRRTPEQPVRSQPRRGASERRPASQTSGRRTTRPATRVNPRNR